MKATDVPYGKFQAAIFKLVQGLGESGSDLISRLDTDDGFRDRVIKYMLAGAPSTAKMRSKATGFYHGEKGFPILYDCPPVLIYGNPAGEIFVLNNSECSNTLRITVVDDGFDVAAQNGVIVPGHVTKPPTLKI